MVVEGHSSTNFKMMLILRIFSPEHTLISHMFSSVQLLSLVWLFGTPWIAARKGLPVYHQLPEFTQTRVRVSDAIQPSHPLSSPSSPAPSSSQHQSLFQWVNSPHEVAKVLEFQPQHQSFQWTWFPLGWTDWISLQSKGLSRVFSNTTVQKHQNSSALSLLHSPTLTSILGWSWLFFQGASVL